MTRRERWKAVLDSEVKRWSALSATELASTLAGGKQYEVEWESAKYQVEVELLKITTEYVQVIVSVDDGTLPASIRPECETFIRKKES